MLSILTKSTLPSIGVLGTKCLQIIFVKKMDSQFFELRDFILQITFFSTLSYAEKNANSLKFNDFLFTLQNFIHANEAL